MQKKKWIAIVSFMLALVVLVVGLLLHKKQQLEQLRNEALEELVRNAGQYDEQSIVLYNTSKAKSEQLAAMYGAKLRITADGRFATLTLPEGTTIRDAYAMDESLRYIDQMTPDYQVRISELEEEETPDERLPMRPDYFVSDEDYEQQTYLDYLNMGSTWWECTGYGVTVAVIDTGIDTDHPEFAGRISEYSYNATEDKIVANYLREDGSYDWSLIEDEQGHGTAVTGVLAASMNADNVVGIAPHANILVIKAECDENGTFKRASDLVFGLYYAIEQNVQVVNMSFGTTQDLFTAATQLAYDSDIICVAAAGNEATSQLTYPAANEHVIAVGALGEGWEMAGYSNYGENVTLVAPGTTYTSLMDGAYGYMRGTSFASPIVAGAMALYAQRHYYYTVDDVEELLLASCYDLGEPGRDWYYGLGALDISALLLEKQGKIIYDMLTDELENQEGIFVEGHSLQEYPEPERLYAVFDGWYYDDSFTQECNYYEDKFYGEVTLYAKWVNEDDGVPFTYVILEDGTVEIRSYTGHRRFITIPDMIEDRVVSSIGDGAFAGEMQLREVTLPSGLKRIGESAFAGCSNLTHIEIPESVTQIGNSAFADNIRLSAVAFLGENQLQSIGTFAFSGCGKLQRIELPASVTYMDGTAFYGSTSLWEIKVQAGNTAFCDKDGVLFNYSGSTLVAFPAACGNRYTIPEQTQYIGDYAFAYARINQIDLAKVQQIGKFAFVYSQIETLTLADHVVALGEGAFCSAANLRQVTIGRGLTTIPMRAFEKATALNTVTIPNGIQQIETMAFQESGLQSVHFEEGSALTLIGGSAFAGTSLTEVQIPASVLVIGDQSFAVTPLHQVEIPADSVLRSIGSGAFKGCAWLETIVLPQSLQTIGSRAFEACGQLKTIELPQNVHTIGEFAFQQSGLTEITVPSSVTQLGYGAFALCSNLPAVTIAEDNVAYYDEDGIVYTADRTMIHTYPAGKYNYYYTMPASTQLIAPWAFAGTNNLRSVYFSEALTEIGEYAFAKSFGLRELEIPDNVTRIGRYAFMETSSLYTVTFNETSKLSRLGMYAFAYSGLSSFTVPANVSSMAQMVFYGCTQLNEITFAENSKLTSISAYMFDGCNYLSRITFLSGSALTSIQAHGLEGLSNLTYIDFGDAKLTNVDNFAFRFCRELPELQLPETVTNIGRYAFYGCESLSQLTLPASMEHIGSYAFLGTKDIELYFVNEVLPYYLDEDWDRDVRGYYTGVISVAENESYQYAMLASGNIAILKYMGTDTHVDLTGLELGAPVSIIGGSAFANSNVVSVKLPDTLTAIQAEAFVNCPLEDITIPANVTFIGRQAFADTAIKELVFTAGSQLMVMEQYAFKGTKNLCSVILPASMTTMGTGVFQESGLQNVEFEAGTQITQISQCAFADTKLTEVTLPDSVTLVDHNAFNNVQTLKRVTFGNNEGIRLMSNAFYHTGLEQLYIPANVNYIGEYCFVALSNLTAFEIDENNPNYTVVDGLLLTKSGRKLIAAPAGRTGSVTVPQSVEEIGFGAFEESQFDQILFDENTNILTFGYRAFFKAGNITSITIPRSVVSIDYYAFAYCENLQTVIFPEDNFLKGIYEGAFIGCDNLEGITLPESVVEIAEFAFYGCSKLDALPVSDGHKLIGIYDYAFAYTGLQGEFVAPETLVDIGSYAFLGNKLTKVTIPDANKKQLIIGIGVFEGCNQLTEITLPFLGASFENEEISWLGYIFGAGSYQANAIYVPASLRTVTLTDGISVIGTGGFAGCTNLEEIHVPDSVSVLRDFAFADTTAKHTLTNTIMTYHTDYQGTHAAATQGHFGKGLYGHLQLAEGVTEVDGAFDGCRNLESVVLPDTVTVIGGDTFCNCENLRSVTLSASLTRLGSDAFTGCNNLQQIHIPSVAAWCNVTLEGYYAIPFANNNAKLMVNGEPVVDLVIPEGITAIHDYSFAYFDQLVSVTIPESVQSIGKYAFYFCQNLQTVNMPSDLDYLGERAFAYCKNLQSITVPAGLTEIPDYAFDDCRNLKYVEIPDGVTSIGASAFSYCGSIESVVIPEGVTTIGQYAFSHCDLKDLVIPKSLTSIGQNAFYWSYPESVHISDLAAWCRISFENAGASPAMGAFYLNGMSIADLVIPDGVTAIADYAFYGNTSIRAVTIPASVTSIGTDAFRDCEKLHTIRNNSDMELTLGSSDHGYIASYGTVLIDRFGNRTYADGYEETADGFLFRYEDGIYKLLGYTGTEETVTLPDSIYGCVYEISEFNGPKHVIVPEGITAISERAFYNATTLQTITLPESITSIGDFAFYGCSNLQAIHMPSGLTFIGSNAFNGCQSLTELELPDSVSYIGDGAFCLCSGLVHVKLPGSLTQISSSLFSYCSSLKSIEIPDTVQKVGSFAFEECAALTGLRIPGGVTEIEVSTFRNCSSMAWVDIPTSVTRISHYAFAGCNSLTEIALPASVTYIGNSALPAGAKVTFVGESPVFQIVDGIMYSADMGKLIGPRAELSGEIVIPDGVWYIEDDAFANCTQITSIQLPESIKHIGFRAFQGCTGLTNVVLPDNITDIGDSAFAYCTNLVSIHLPEKLTGVAERMFEGCTSLEIISIPAKARGIYCTFYSCNIKQVHITDLAAWCKLTKTNGILSSGAGLYLNGELVQELVIPESITTLPDKAFANYSHLTSVVIPDHVVSIGVGAFRDCENLQHVSIGSGITTLSKEAFYDCENLTTVVLSPELITIGENAFDQCDNVERLYVEDLESWLNITFLNYGSNPMAQSGAALYVNGELLRELTIPEGMTDIPDSVFSGCTSLEKVIIPEGVVSIGDSAFYRCSNLKEIIVPSSVQSIGEYAFGFCGNLQKINLPAGLTRIAEFTFHNCYSLENIDIPDGVQFIGRNAFSSCESLRQITLPQGLTSIEESAFDDCYDLRFIEIPDSVTTIGSFAFYHSGLSEIVIPDNVTQIGSYAFAYCHSLREITLGRNLQSIGAEAFLMCYNLDILHNYSSLELAFESSDYGAIAYYPYVFIDENGNKTFRQDYYETADGFVYSLTYNWRGEAEYALVGYLGDADTVTLPQSIDGHSYAISCFYGAKHVIIPAGITTIHNQAFDHNSELLSVTIPDSVTVISNTAFNGCCNLTSLTLPKHLEKIYSNAFSGCTSLTELRIPDSVYYIGSGVFSGTTLADPEYLAYGMRVVDGWLVSVDPEVKYLYNIQELRGAVSGAYYDCNLLKEIIWNDDSNIPSNVETIYIKHLFELGKSVPSTLTLSNIVICDSVGISDLMRKPNFVEAEGVTVYVEGLEEDLRWDVNFPNWSKGNKVVYGGEWHLVSFSDHHGQVIQRAPCLNAQVIRLPFYELLPDAYYTYEMIGWDLDGDGQPDNIPATSVVDINAKLLVEAYERCYTVSFVDQTTGTVYYSLQLPYGTKIIAPGEPTKQGHDFLRWVNLFDGMTVEGDTVIYAGWQHHGGGHVYEEPVWVDATCTEPGYYKHTCSVCGESYGDGHTQPLGHTYHSVQIPAGCTTVGYVQYTCSCCGDSYREENAPAKGHNYGKWTVDVAATCQQHGLRHHICKDCGHYEEESIRAKGHSFIMTESTASTCTDHGHQTYRCADCGTVVTDKTPLKNHTYVKEYASADFRECLEDLQLNVLWAHEGNQVYYYVCQDCGHMLHIEEEAAQQAGTASNACRHTVASWNVIWQPSCGSRGMQVLQCDHCGRMLEASAYGEFQEHHLVHYAGKNATCTEDGWHAYDVCTVCGYSSYRTIAATGHHHNVTVKQPTCTERGYTTHTCHCGDSFVDSYKSALGHKYGSWTQTKSPTCTEKGEERHDCERCDHYETRKVNAKGHSFTHYVSDGNATETKDGTKTAICDHGCGTTHTVTDEGSMIVDKEITSNKFTVKNGFISKIKVGTTVAQIKDGITEKNIKILQDGKEVSNTALAGTGMVVQLISNGKVVDEVTIIVTGDTNGDGKITVTDMIAVKSHILKKSTLTGAAARAADTSADSGISITDFIQIKAHILGKSQVTPAAAKQQPKNVQPELIVTKSEPKSEGQIGKTQICSVEFYVPGKEISPCTAALLQKKEILI